MTGRTVLLDACRPGSGGTIVEIRSQGPIGQRLMEMGLVEGAEIRVVRTAPLGDPIEVTVMDYPLSLRRSEAGAVVIEVAP